MAFWTKVGDLLQKHDGIQPKMWALFRINVAVNGTSPGIPISDCSMYRRDPSKYPNEPDILAAEMEAFRQKEFAKQVRKVMGRKKKRTE